MLSLRLISLLIQFYRNSNKTTYMYVFLAFQCFHSFSFASHIDRNFSYSGLKKTKRKAQNMDSSTLTSLSRGSFSSSVEDSSESEANLTLSDRLKVFKTSNFDPDAYVTSKCQTMNEKVFFSLIFFSPCVVLVVLHIWILINIQQVQKIYLRNGFAPIGSYLKVFYACL